MQKLVYAGILAALATVGSGCQQSGPVHMGHDILPVPESTISVHQLAQRLGLTIYADTGTLVSLRNAVNSVTLFPNPSGQAYVNGKPVGPRGGIVRISGVLFVPTSLESYIRSALKPLSISVKPPLAYGRRIVIDPGHGGKDPGAISPIGINEKSVNLAVAGELAQILKQDGFDVILTRQADVFIELDERAGIANRAKADLFVSIHADSCNNRSARGSTVYICRNASRKSFAAAKAVDAAMERAGMACRGVREANYRVLVSTDGPAILVELGYLSNIAEAKALADHNVQGRLATAIAEGIRTALSQ